MHYRTLGSTGLQVSEIGFGAWGIGGDSQGSISYGKTDDGTSLSALKKALELGINFYDTSDFYGFGHSEELIGKAFQNQRDKVIIATKAGMLSYSNQQNFEEKYIHNAILNSLKRLKSDYIDLFQLHNPPVNLENLERLVKLLLKLKAEGKIRALGVSVNSPAEAETFINLYNFETIQINFNLIDQRPVESGLFDLCKIKGTGIIARTPLNFGFLSGNIKTIDDFPENDHRSKWSKDQLSIWLDAPNKFSFAYSARPENSFSEVALTYCLSYEEVSTVIPGILTPAEAELNAKASNTIKFSKEELVQIENTYKSNQFFLRKK